MIRSAAVIVCLLSCLPGCQSPQAEARRELEQEIAARESGRKRALEAYRRGLKQKEDGNLEDAARSLADSVRDEDRNPEAWIALGAVEFERGRLYDAAVAFDRAAKLLPERYEPRYNLGTVLQAAGHYPKAMAEFEAALERSPEQVEVMENLARCYIRANQKLDRAADLIARCLAVEHRPEWQRWLQMQQVKLTVRRQRQPTPPVASPTSPASPSPAQPNP